MKRELRFPMVFFTCATLFRFLLFFFYFQQTKNGISDVINVLVAIVCSVLLLVMFGKAIYSAIIVSLKSQGKVLRAESSAK